MFYAVIGKPQTWRHIGYLLLAFPLGIFYFVFLVTGLSLGFGLFITLLGIPIVVGVLAASYGMGEFERVITNALLDLDIPPAGRLSIQGGFWMKIKALFASSETWKRVGYLFLRFPFGIMGLVLVSLTAGSFSLVATPAFYTRSWWSTSGWPSDLWVIDTTWEALVVALGGLLVGFVLLHVINWLATAWGVLAQAMLGPSGRPAMPAVTSASVEDGIESSSAKDTGN